MSLAAIRRQIDEIGQQLAPVSAELRLEEMADTRQGRHLLRWHDALARHGLLHPLPVHIVDAVQRNEEEDIQAGRDETEALRQAGYRRLADCGAGPEREKTLILLGMREIWEYVEMPGVLAVYGVPGWEAKMLAWTTAAVGLSGLTRTNARSRLASEVEELGVKFADATGLVRSRH